MNELTFQDEEAAGFWFGRVNTGGPGQLGVYANYDENSTNYKGVLRYQVISSTVQHKNIKVLVNNDHTRRLVHCFCR